MLELLSHNDDPSLALQYVAQIRENQIIILRMITGGSLDKIFVSYVTLELL
jgi:hypothetical protein